MDSAKLFEAINTGIYDPSIGLGATEHETAAILPLSMFLVADFIRSGRFFIC